MHNKEADEMNKSSGYILIVIGLLIILLCSVTPIKDKMPDGVKNVLDNNITLTVGIVIFIIGLFMIYQSRSPRGVKEVPIYKGKEVVGYRRLKK